MGVGSCGVALGYRVLLKGKCAVGADADDLVCDSKEGFGTVRGTTSFLV